MAALVTALDNYTSKQIGEKGHVEFGWSNSIRENILQFSFQLTRTGKETLVVLQNKLITILTTLKHKLSVSSIIEKEEARGYLSILYRMIGNTRDIIDGKGEYALSYMLLEVWNKEHPELAKFVFQHFLVYLHNILPYYFYYDVNIQKETWFPKSLLNCF